MGTIGALLYAFYLERRNSKKINDLANIVDELRKQNELFTKQYTNGALPKFESPTIERKDNLVIIKLINKGQTARVTECSETSNNFDVSISNFTITHNETLQLFCFPIAKTHSKDMEFNINIDYVDIFGQKYSSWIKGENCSIFLSGNSIDMPK